MAREPERTLNLPALTAAERSGRQRPPLPVHETRNIHVTTTHTCSLPRYKGSPGLIPGGSWPPVPRHRIDELCRVFVCHCSTNLHPKPPLKIRTFAQEADRVDPCA